MDASTRIGTLGINYRITPRWRVDLQGQYIDARADAGERYARWIHSVNVMWRF